MKRTKLRIGLTTAAVITALLLGPVPAATAAPAGSYPDGTLLQEDGGKRVALIVAGARIDFADAKALTEAGCANGDPTVIPPKDFDAIPAGPDPLYAAVDDEVAVDRLTPDPHYRTDCRPVHRADRRAPEVIFAQGFAAKDVHNGQYDIRSYVLKNQPSPFVSTSYRDDLYKEWKSPYYYFLDAPGGIDVNATIGDDHQYAEQEEVAFPGGIMSRFIEKGCPVDRQTLKLVKDKCVENPNFEPWRG